MKIQKQKALSALLGGIIVFLLLCILSPDTVVRFADANFQDGKILKTTVVADNLDIYGPVEIFSVNAEASNEGCSSLVDLMREGDLLGQLSLVHIGTEKGTVLVEVGGSIQSEAYSIDETKVQVFGFRHCVKPGTKTVNVALVDESGSPVDAVSKTVVVN